MENVTLFVHISVANKTSAVSWNSLVFFMAKSMNWCVKYLNIAHVVSPEESQTQREQKELKVPN